MVLVGGNAMLPGFKSRLKKELDRLLVTPQYQDLKKLSEDFAFLVYSYPPNYISWLGASIMGALESITTFSTTLEQYQTKHKLGKHK
jgi:actin-related protein 10